MKTKIHPNNIHKPPFTINKNKGKETHQAKLNFTLPNHHALVNFILSNQLPITRQKMKNLPDEPEMQRRLDREIGCSNQSKFI